MTEDRTFADREQLGADGSVRKAHYGEGEQPWDAIVRLGWGPAFAASCVLRYLRRTKDRAHSLESARWYFGQLQRNRTKGEWFDAYRELLLELTDDERLTLLGERVP